MEILGVVLFIGIFIFPLVPMVIIRLLKQKEYQQLKAADPNIIIGDYNHYVFGLFASFGLLICFLAVCQVVRDQEVSDFVAAGIFFILGVALTIAMLVVMWYPRITISNRIVCYRTFSKKEYSVPVGNIVKRYAMGRKYRVNLQYIRVDGSAQQSFGTISYNGMLSNYDQIDKYIYTNMKS